MLSKVVTVLRKPSILFRFGTPRKRRAYIRMARVLKFITLFKRKRIAEYFTHWHGILDTSSMNKCGYGRYSGLIDSRKMIKTLLEAERDFESHLDNRVTNQNKQYLQKVAWSSPLTVRHPYIDLATDEEIVAAVTSYFGYVPLLGEIYLWYSPNDSAETNDGSQLFHLDYADTKQFKVFIPIRSIESESGPTTLIPADISAQISSEIRYKLSGDEIRVRDSVIAKFCSSTDWVKLTGEPGELMFADTSRCFHFGSRSAVQPRFLLMIQYISPLSFTLSLDHKSDSTFGHLDHPNLPDYKRALFGGI